MYSTRGVDIWSEEKKRKPPLQPNIADYKSIMSESGIINSTIDRSTIHGAYPQSPLLPAHLVTTPPIIRDVLPPASSGVPVHSPYSSNLRHLAAVRPQEGLVPSAPPVPPPPTDYNLTERKIHYPPNFKHEKIQSPTNAKPTKSSPQIPNKHNPVVLIRMETKPSVPPPVYMAQSPIGNKNYNTNNGNQTRELGSPLIGYENISHPSDPFLFVNSASTPNLLLDIDNSPTCRATPKVPENPKTEENLIEFVEIKPINTNDVYLQLFPEANSSSDNALHSGMKNRVL